MNENNDRARERKKERETRGTERERETERETKRETETEREIEVLTLLVPSLSAIRTLPDEPQTIKGRQRAD